MELNIYGLKCDNEKCNYNDESIQVEDYEKYINIPCPRCSEPLLTQADYDTTMQIIQLAKIAEKLGYGNIEEAPDELMKIKIDLDGTGIPKFDGSKVENKTAKV